MHKEAVQIFNIHVSQRQDWGDDGCRQDQQLARDLPTSPAVYMAPRYMEKRDQFMGEYMDDIDDIALAQVDLQLCQDDID